VRIPRPWKRLAVICAVAATALAAPSAAAAVPTQPDTTSGDTHRVTLLTGDRVEYTESPGARPRVVVDPAERPDGRPVTFTTTAVTGPGGQPALYVVPSDTEPYLAARSVDRELFNVRQLTREGLDDKASATLPLIVTGSAAAMPAARATRALPAVRGQAVRVQRDQAGQFWTAVRAPGAVGKVWLDHRVTAALDQSVPQIGAPAAWQAGFDGTGVSVAVLDTGVDADHPDLHGKVGATSDFTESGTVVDGHGHGTHVASTIVGSGAASGGRYKGVAPGAKLMVGKVLADDGSGLDSWIMAGMEWAATNGAKVVSMSLGAEPTDGTDPVSEELNALTAQTGTLFVVAAGNSGTRLGVGSPGSATSALTVGAVDKQDHMAWFSSGGPRLGDGAAKPEIVAPGVNIVAARAAGTSLGTPVGDFYTTLSGTSMATPHVAGAAAILAQRHPDWTAGRLKDALVGAATDIGADWSVQGAGRVDVARAVRQDLTGPAAADLGRLEPNGGTVTRPLRYANGGPTPVTLTLALTMDGWNGRPAPSGLGRLSATTLTVPAGGTASVDLTLDPTAGTGEYGGTVAARTADAVVAVRTVVAGYIAPPMANLTVRVTDYRGQPAPFASVYLVDAAADPAAGNDPFATAITTAFVTNGVGTARVSRGALVTAMTSQTTLALDTRRTDLLVSPEVPVSGDTEIALDARKARPHRVGTLDPTDELAKATEVVRGTAGAVVSIQAFTRLDTDTVTYATPVPAPAHGDLDTYDKRTLSDAGVRLTVNGFGFHPRYDPYNTPAKLAGDRSTTVVWAGQGTPADVTGLDLAGKLALVGIRIPDGTANPLGYASQAATAATRVTAKAGALATLVYVDSPGAIPLPRPVAVPVPQLFLSRAEGALLRGWAGAVVKLTGNPVPHVQYNLLYADRGVPAGRTDVAVPGQLVTIPTRYHADKPMTYEKNWYAFGTRSLVAFRERVLFAAPVARVELVGPANPTVSWTRWTTQNDQAPNRPPLIASLVARNSYPTGGQLLPEERWYEGPLLEDEPVSSGVCGLCRGGPDGNLFIPAWHLGDSDTGHAIQSWPDYRSDVHLFRGTTEIPPQPQTNSLPMPTFRLPPAADNYRLVVDGPTPWNPAVRPVQHVSTEWTFRSAAPSGTPGGCPAGLGGVCIHQPLIQVRYQLGLDLANHAPAGGRFTFTASADLPAGAAGGPVAGLWLWSSSDAGTTWRPATVERLSPTRYRITVNNPATAGGDGTIWLKAEAWDSAGDRVRQTVHGAYALG
jgi:subtilisin family serine protease